MITIFGQKQRIDAEERFFVMWRIKQLRRVQMPKNGGNPDRYGFAMAHRRQHVGCWTNRYFRCASIGGDKLQVKLSGSKAQTNG